MRANYYKPIFHPKLGKIVYKHLGSGLIVDNIFKPMNRMFSAATKAVLKPLGKKALKSGIESAGDKIGKKAVQFADDKIGRVAEKSGHLFIKDLQALGKPKRVKDPKREEDYNLILNRLISGSGMKKKRKNKK